MQNVVVFGLLAALATAVAFSADLLLAPALLTLGVSGAETVEPHAR